MSSAHDASLKPSILAPGDVPLVQTGQYCQVGLAVTDVAASRAFYSHLGFSDCPSAAGPAAVAVMANAAGLELHLIPADKPLVEPEKNILMDFPEQKYPGHTHICFSVSSVAGAASFLGRRGIPISGERPPPHVRKAATPERPLVAIFCRDPDRNVVELESTAFLAAIPDAAAAGSGPAKAAAAGGGAGGADPALFDLAADMAAIPQPMDHAGTRMAQPPARWAWYAKTLGFATSVREYELNPEPLKNGFPWISSNAKGAELNILPNANLWTCGPTAPVPAGGDGGAPAEAALEGTRRNILTDESGALLPGIVYVGLTVADAAAAGAALRAAGAAVFSDDDVAAAAPAGLPAAAAAVSFGAGGERRTGAVLRLGAAKVKHLGGESVFLLDDDATIFRLVSSKAARVVTD